MVQLTYKVLNDLSASAKEAYKTLRTNIRFCGVINEIKTLTITSCVPGEGKTTTALNLAMSMADAGMKTLLVNMDLRRPMVEKVLKLDSEFGITNYMTGEIELDEAIFPTNMNDFYIAPCGPIPPNPTELIGSKKFLDLVKNISDRHFKIIDGKFDMVIFDTPPLGSVIDAALLSSMTDGTILVIKSKSINYKLAQNVKEQLEKANANLIGVVLNNVRKKDYQYNYGYGGKYNSYYTDDDSEKKGFIQRLFSKINFIRK